MPSPSRHAVVSAGLLGFTGVALGAFGAHVLKDRLAANGATAIWQTAVLYHLIHAVAVLALGSWVDAGPAARWIGRCWIAGVILFSGSLYGISLGGPGILGPITPIGGIFLLTGWLLLAWNAGRQPKP